MVAFKIDQMGGLIPRMDSDVLPEKMSADAVDCDLRSGTLDGLPARVFQISLPGSRKAYRLPEIIPGVDGQQFVWLPLPSEFSSVVRSPVANDLKNRIYWTNPADMVGPFWTTYDRLNTGQKNYQLGIVQPPDGYQLTSISTDGTLDGSIPLQGRVYVYTHVNEFGEESHPNTGSELVEGAPDGAWNVIGLPPTPPPNPPDKPDYPPVTQINLYRTVIGNDGSVDFYLVASFVYVINPPPGTWGDPFDDIDIVFNNTLQTQTWQNPPQALDGLVALPNGMMVGFTNNTLHFCEPYRPHSWPPIYDKSVLYDVSTLTVWQGSLMVLTVGYPSTGSGNSPANFLLTQVQVSEPCVARGSVVTTLQGVFYASQNGLILMTYAGLLNATFQTMTRKIWVDEYNARTLIGTRHRSQYMACDQQGGGFLYDTQETQLGFMKLKDQMFDIISIWTDEYNGDVYMMASDGKVYLWDSPDPTVGLRPFRWKSKTFTSQKAVSLGAAHVLLDDKIEHELGSCVPMSDPSLELPDDCYAIFRLYSGSKLNLIMERQLYKINDIFRLTGGFRSFDWQFELVSRIRIKSVELASTMKELQGI